MNNIKVNWIGEVASDCTRSFELSFDRGLTTEQFVDYVLKERRDEWGEIRVSSNYSPIELIVNSQTFVKYSHGKLDAIDQEIYEVIKDLVVTKITGYGGYSLMDYFLTFEKPDKQVFDIVKKVRYEEIEERKKNKKSFPTLHYN